MDEVTAALNGYLAAREEVGYEVLAVSVRQTGKNYFLYTEGRPPVTLGHKAETVWALKVAAFNLLNLAKK